MENSAHGGKRKKKKKKKEEVILISRLVHEKGDQIIQQSRDGKEEEKEGKADHIYDMICDLTGLSPGPCQRPTTS